MTDCGAVYHLTIVCSDAVLYDTVLQGVSLWNQKNSPRLTIKLHYLSPNEWAGIRKTGTLQGTVVLLEGLPWRLRLFTRIQKTENLGYGVKIQHAKAFSFLTANTNKLLCLRKYYAFCDDLSLYTNKQIKENRTVMPTLLRKLLVISFLAALKNAPIFALPNLIMFTWLLWEEKKVKQLQYLYGTILFLGRQIKEWKNIAKPADIK